MGPSRARNRNVVALRSRLIHTGLVSVIMKWSSGSRADSAVTVDSV